MIATIAALLFLSGLEATRAGAGDIVDEGRSLTSPPRPESMIAERSLLRGASLGNNLFEGIDALVSVFEEADPPTGAPVKPQKQRTTTFQFINGDLYEVEVDEGGDGMMAAGAAELVLAGAITEAGSDLDRQTRVWDFVATFDSYKTSGMYELVNGKPTLKTVKYMMLPIWWDGDDTNDPNLAIDAVQIDDIMQQVQDYYLDMSWGKVLVTWQTLPQQVLTGVTNTAANFDNTATAARGIVMGQSYAEGVDYDAISLVYHSAASGPFSGGGGWATVNGNFMWNSYPMGFEVTRHEVGHNFGHPHHKKHSYEYRNSGRPYMKEDWGGNDYGYDGWDMMSGGNGYPVSDFLTASKWFYNWIEDSSIIHMQPEGPTTECPTCVASGSFQLVPFDDRTLPPASNLKMGIHIPIAAESNKLYSFWLSYRGVDHDGGTKSLSVHFTEFSLDGIFGATYDSHRYFASGPDDKYRAFVLVDTCYHIFPSAYMKDRDYVAAGAVQPVICVDAMDEVTSIDVTVSFIDPQNPPLPSTQVDPISMAMDCSGAATSYTLDATKFHSIHVQRTGLDGEVSISMCTDASSSSHVVASAFLYDQYPYSATTYESPASYGAFKRLDASALECCTPGATVNVPGAKVVAIKQNQADFLHFNEIEIFDENGVNVALDGECFSFSIGWGGNPSCLNDGITGTYPDTCNSHSSGTDSNNFDYCIFNEPTTITRIKIWPWNDPTRTWMTDRLNDLTLSVYADVSGQGATASFLGEIYSEPLLNVFTASQRGPYEINDPVLSTSISCPNTTPNPSKSLSYRSDFDNTFIAIPPSTGATTAASETSITITCTANSCMQNSYKSNGACVPCPLDYYSAAGSTDVSSCTPCADGTFLRHTYDQECTLSTSSSEITSSMGWRIWASYLHLEASWWDVAEVEFYGDVGCAGEKISNTFGTPIDSGNAGPGWGPEKAFGQSGIWGGRSAIDVPGIFWVGKTFANPVSVRCVQVQNSSDKSTTEIRIQAFNSNTNRWENAWVQTGFDTASSAWNTVPLLYETESPTNSPSAAPTSSPTSGPTNQPATSPPTKNPTANPSSSPSTAPTSTPTRSPTNSPTAAPTSSPTSGPTNQPATSQPTKNPTANPSSSPSISPTSTPTKSPTLPKDGWCSDGTGRCSVDDKSDCFCSARRKLAATESQEDRLGSEPFGRRHLVDCSSYTEKDTCNDAGCRWGGQGPIKSCSPDPNAPSSTTSPTNLPTKSPTVPVACECLSTAFPTSSPTHPMTNAPTSSPTALPTATPVGCVSGMAAKHTSCSCDAECSSNVCKQNGTCN